MGEVAKGARLRPKLRRKEMEGVKRARRGEAKLRDIN